MKSWARPGNKARGRSGRTSEQMIFHFHLPPPTCIFDRGGKVWRGRTNSVYYISLIPRPHPAFRHLQYGKAWRAWYLFSCEHDVIGKWWKFSEQTAWVSVFLNWLHAHRSVYITTILHLLDTCGKLPATLALFAVLGPVHPRTIKPFLPSFLSWHHSREKRYQALSSFSVLMATESWAGPGNEASITWHCEVINCIPGPIKLKTAFKHTIIFIFLLILAWESIRVQFLLIMALVVARV